MKLLFAGFLVWFVALSDAQDKTCTNVVLNVAQFSNGSEQSTNAPYDMKANTNCKWTFKSNDSNQMVYIFVDSLGLAPSTSLIVMDSNTPLNLDPSDLQVPLVLALNAANSTISFNAGNDPSSPSPLLRRISFRWQTSSDPSSTTMTTEFMGPIKSPKYVPRANATLNMVWIVSGKNNLSGIALAFQKFNIGTGMLSFDASPSTEEYPSLTGSNIPVDILFRNSINVVINLTLPIDLPDLGFFAIYKDIYQACSNKISINATQNISLTPVAAVLPIKCVWIFEGPVNATLSLTLTKVAVPAKGNISNSHLSVHDGGSTFSKSIALFPGSALPKDYAILTSGNLMWVSYSYFDSNVPNITIRVSVHNQGGILHGSDSFGVKASPENVTLPSDNSVWSLVVDPDMIVRVDVQSLSDLQADDQLSFYDGNAAIADHLIATFDMNSTNIPVVSTKNAMFVKARNFTGSSSFSASFKGISQGNYILSSSAFASHQLNSIDGKSNFTWIIRPTSANDTDIIDLTISVLSITSNLSSLLIFEGLTPSNDGLLVNLTNANNQSSLAVHISASKGALIVYSNVGETPITGVILDAYYHIEPTCLRELNITNGETKLSSPSYPNSYPVNADCTYSLVTTANKSLLLTFEDVELADGHFVALMNGSTPVFNLTNNAIPDDYISSNGSRLLIKFVTRSMSTNVTRGRGFSVRLLAIDCGSHVGDAQNSISTPNWPNSLQNSTICVWSIAIPKGKNVGIISLDVEAQPVSSSPSVLKFVDGGVLNAGLSSETINASTTKYLSRTSKMMIVYNYTQSDPKVFGTPYKFTYTTKECLPSELCSNGICLHDSWKCNGVNDCGDFTDEFNCTAGPTIESSGGVSVATFVVFIFIMFFTGVAVALVAPNLYRRFRSPRNYQSFGDAVDT